MPNSADVAAWSGAAPPKGKKTTAPAAPEPAVIRYTADEARKKMAGFVKSESGKKSKMHLSLASTLVDEPRITTGLSGLDYVFGGGVPLGHSIEISGWEGSGKTTLALTIIAQAQSEGLLCGFIDVEQTFDAGYASMLGIDRDSLLVARPDTGEEALETLLWMLDNGFTIVALDSIAAMLPRAENEGDMGDAHMSLQARLMGQAFRKAVPRCRTYNSTILWLNQLRVGPAKYKGDSGEYTPGGNGARFYCSIRIRTQSSKKTQEGSGDERVGVGKEINVTAFKNKTAPEDRRWRFYVRYGMGFDVIHDLVKAAKRFDAMEMKGSWFWLDGERLCNGEAALLELVSEDPVLRKKVQALVAAKVRELTFREQTNQVEAGAANDDSEGVDPIRDEEGPAGLPLVAAGPVLSGIGTAA